MEKQVKGVVLEVSGGTMLLLTDGAELCSGPCPAAVPAVGDVVVMAGPAHRRSGRRGGLVPLAFWAAAAALVALVFAWNLPRQVAAPAAIIIAVDINPSLELRLNPAGRVMAATPRNADGTRLLAGLALTQLPAADAVAAVVEQAGALGYLSADQPPVIMLAVVQLDAAAAAPDAGALGEAARRAAAGKSANALVTVYTPDPSILADSERLGLSPNAVTALNLARARQLTVDPAGVAVGGLRQALAAAGTSLPELLDARPQGMIVLGGAPVTVAPQPPTGFTEDGDRPDPQGRRGVTGTRETGETAAAIQDDDAALPVDTTGSKSAGSSDSGTGGSSTGGEGAGGTRGPASQNSGTNTDDDDGDTDHSGPDDSGGDDRSEPGDDNSAPGSGGSDDDAGSGSGGTDDDLSGSGGSGSSDDGSDDGSDDEPDKDD